MGASLPDREEEGRRERRPFSRPPNPPLPLPSPVSCVVGCTRLFPTRSLSLPAVCLFFHREREKSALRRVWFLFLCSFEHVWPRDALFPPLLLGDGSWRRREPFPAQPPPLVLSSRRGVERTNTELFGSKEPPTMLLRFLRTCGFRVGTAGKEPKQIRYTLSSRRQRRGYSQQARRGNPLVSLEVFSASSADSGSAPPGLPFSPPLPCSTTQKRGVGSSLSQTENVRDHKGPTMLSYAPRSEGSEERLRSRDLRLPAALRRTIPRSPEAIANTTERVFGFSSFPVFETETGMDHRCVPQRLFEFFPRDPQQKEQKAPWATRRTVPHAAVSTFSLPPSLAFPFPSLESFSVTDGRVVRRFASGEKNRGLDRSSFKQFRESQHLNGVLFFFCSFLARQKKKREPPKHTPRTTQRRRENSGVQGFPHRCPRQEKATHPPPREEREEAPFGTKAPPFES